MRSFVAVFMLVMSVVSLGFAQNKERINRVLTTARWVYVVSDEGDEFSGRVSQEDREAIANLIAAIQKWGYYKISTRGQGAELVFVVHSEGGVGFMGGVNTTTTRGDAGDNGDALIVYDARQYPNGGSGYGEPK